MFALVANDEWTKLKNVYIVLVWYLMLKHIFPPLVIGLAPICPNNLNICGAEHCLYAGDKLSLFFCFVVNNSYSSCVETLMQQQTARSLGLDMRLF